MKIDLQKGAKNIGTAMEKAAVIGKKTADSTIASAQSIVAKAQEENQKSLL